MKTHETIGKVEILKYLAHGYDLDYSVKQAKSVTLHRFDQAIDRASDELSWFCELHQEAIEKLAHLTDWFRPKAISDRPEVIRDLTSIGIIESKRQPADVFQGKHGNEVLLYRKSLNYLIN